MCMKKITLFFLLCLFVLVQVSAQQTINVPTAGTLKSVLIDQGIDLATVTDLTLTGNIDARDFKCMRDDMTAISVLDLSKVSIAAYSGADGAYPAQMDYPENVIPATAFFSFAILHGSLKSACVLYVPAESVSAYSTAPQWSQFTNIQPISSSSTTIIVDGTVVTVLGITAGNLKSALLAESVDLTTITELTLTGYIDARDFVTMRDDMTAISVLDLSKVSIAAYSGADGAYPAQMDYPENVIPATAFFSFAILHGSLTLTSIVLPESAVEIADMAFYLCTELTTVVIPASVENIADGAFASTALTSVTSLATIPPTLGTGVEVFIEVNKSACVLYVPAESVSAYSTAPQWSQFTNIQPISSSSVDEFLVMGQTETYLGLACYASYNMSANGRYLVANVTEYDVLWDTKTNTITSLFSTSELIEQAKITDGWASVNNNGTVAGVYPDPNHIITAPYGSMPAWVAGVWKAGTWTSLGLGLIGDDMYSTASHPYVNGINNDGTKVYGTSFINRGSLYVPVIWDVNGTEEIVRMAAPSERTRINSISGDGSVIGGWSIYGGVSQRRPVLWKSATEYKVFNYSRGEISHISENGKYAAMFVDGKAAVYDVEADEVIIIDGAEAATAVSNDGVVVGYRSAENGTRKGFVWSKDLNYMTFSDYIEKYAPEVASSLPVGIDFSNDNSAYSFPMHISSDGLTISGLHAVGNTRVVWLLRLKEAPKVYPAPKSLNAKVQIPNRNVVDLTWEAPAIPNGMTISGYRIYRNLNELANVNGSILTYTDNNVPVGHQIEYRVSAIYDDTIESAQSTSSIVTIIDTYELPFIEDFSSVNFTKNYWTRTPRTSMYKAWDIYYYNMLRGYGGGTCATFVTTGYEESGTAFDESLISKPLDARSIDFVQLSYMIRFEHFDNIANNPDHLYVEVTSDAENMANWTTIKEYAYNEIPLVWKLETFDISEQAAGQLFRVRFRVGGENYTAAYIDIDNIRVTSSEDEIEAPQGLIADANFSTKEVNLAWQTSLGSYAMTYSDYNPYQPIGNEGKVFIAANKFEAADMKLFNGYDLTSISVFMNYGDLSTIRLVVFEGNNKVVSQDIPTYTTGVWNTFSLNTPYTISELKGTIYMGIEVLYHNSEDLPIYTDRAVGRFNGKGNLFSENDGQTWLALHNFDLQHNWCIVGNLRNPADYQSGNYPYEGIDMPVAKEGYEIYRNDEKLTEEIWLAPVYLDNVTGTEQTYTYYVRSINAGGMLSGPSDDVVITWTSIKENNISAIDIYPSVVTDGFRIKGLPGTAVVEIFDLRGNNIGSVSVENDGFVSADRLVPGTYLIKLTSDGETRGFKIIKK
jgi:hypothetical protein